jgi:hypothetical protein
VSAFVPPGRDLLWQLRTIASIRCAVRKRGRSCIGGREVVLGDTGSDREGAGGAGGGGTSGGMGTISVSVSPSACRRSPCHFQPRFDERSSDTKL